MCTWVPSGRGQWNWASILALPLVKWVNLSKFDLFEPVSLFVKWDFNVSEEK